MKKIILMGQISGQFREINKSLIAKYEVKACANKLEMFKSMIKANVPDVIVVLMDEFNKSNEEIFAEIIREHGEIPVIYMGISTNTIANKFNRKQFKCVEEPYTVEHLIEKIDYVLEHGLEDEEVEESENAEEQKETEETKHVEEQKPEKKEVKVPIRPRGNDRKSILLVDDSGVYLRLLKGLLEHMYDISMTTSGLKAITMVHEKKPDLILLDYEMPIFDGRETMMKIRESEDTKDIPIVFVTAVNDKAHIKAVLSLRPAGYLLKPVDKDRLYKTVKDIIGG